MQTSGLEINHVIFYLERCSCCKCCLKIISGSVVMDKIKVSTKDVLKAMFPKTPVTEVVA
jgi:hypothetical protein